MNLNKYLNSAVKICIIALIVFGLLEKFGRNFSHTTQVLSIFVTLVIHHTFLYKYFNNI